MLPAVTGWQREASLRMRIKWRQAAVQRLRRGPPNLSAVAVGLPFAGEALLQRCHLVPCRHASQKGLSSGRREASSRAHGTARACAQPGPNAQRPV